MKRLFLVFVVIVGLMLMVASCSDKTTGPSSKDFSIRIKLTDSSGVPLEGYKIGIYPKNHQIASIEKEQRWRSRTTFRFSLAEPYYVSFKIYDHFGRSVRTLIDKSAFDRGNHQVYWLGKNDDGNQVRDGIYKAVIEYYRVDDELVFTDSRFAYLLAEIDLEVSPYRTDERGIVREESILPFPVLYCEETIPIFDTQGVYIGDYVFCDTMRVVVFDGEEKYKFHDFRIIYGSNRLNLNWNEMDERYRQTNNNAVPLFSRVFNDDCDFELSSFTVVQTNQGFLRIKWVTEYEVNMLGYNIYRGQDNELEDATLISSSIIPANNTSQQTTYTFEDVDVTYGNTYYYWLQCVALDLMSCFFGPISIFVEGGEGDEPPVYMNRLFQNYPNPFN